MSNEEFIPKGYSSHSIILNISFWKKSFKKICKVFLPDANFKSRTLGATERILGMQYLIFAWN